MRPRSARSARSSSAQSAGLGVVDVVALGERGVARRVLEVPHERCGVEEVDGGDADGI